MPTHSARASILMHNIISQFKSKIPLILFKILTGLFSTFFEVVQSLFTAQKLSAHESQLGHFALPIDWSVHCHVQHSVDSPRHLGQNTLP